MCPILMGQGTDKIEKTTEILSEARKRIYGQLAEGE